MDTHEVRKIIEAILFVSEEPIGANELAQLVEAPASEIEALLEQMSSDQVSEGRGVVLRRAAGGWRFTTAPEVAEYLERYVAEQRSPKLSQAALETLAIIAYRQPASRAQIAEIRGVASEGVIRTLLNRGLVEEVGRDPGPGLAILYGTTDTFLEKLGLDSLEDLPPLPSFMPDTEAVERMESGLGPGV